MKTFIIRLKGHELSEKLARECAQSCESLNIKYELFDAFTKQNGIKLLTNYNVQSSVLVHDDEWTDGTIGCLASHYFLWRKCIETKEPFFILEHDGIVLRDPSVLLNQIQYACHLDKFSPFNSKDDSVNHRQKYDKLTESSTSNNVLPYPQGRFYGDQTITGTCFRGAHGYIINPSGARKVVEFIDTFGAYPADMCLCDGAMHIQQTEESFVKLNGFFDTLQKHREYSTRKNSILYNK